jgi:hypothetical protein
LSEAGLKRQKSEEDRREEKSHKKC